ncbi:MAG: sigma-70 family RNA polymerase sigma factor [Acidobacteria bacterium]|nr:MAG: sigma-70 family RNA polymerase sigma factor [Acidobacteriota bacterium]REJ99652.1 MAG: sigma-70 family RNA polymerase sigma factor [Acidobacteriota bacterium]
MTTFPLALPHPGPLAPPRGESLKSGRARDLFLAAALEAKPLHPGGSGVGYAEPAARSVGRAAAEAEFAAFHHDTRGALAAYLQQSTGNPAVTEDLVQESYLRLLGAGVALEPRSPARAYLFRIATNLLRDRYRRRDLEFPLEQNDAALPAPERLPPQERRVAAADVRRLLGTLAPRDRQLLWLAHVEQMSHREIGEILGLREGSVRPMLFRARQRLGAALRAAGVGPPPQPEGDGATSAREEQR